MSPNFGFVIVLIAISSQYVCAQVINIEDGTLRGQLRGNHYAFEGIPYAEPPIGSKRFEAPTKNFLTDTHDCYELHESCMRWDPMEGEFNQSVLVGTEDCLYLNIYTPSKFEDVSTSKQFPVLFYIHGGAFMFGSGDDMREKFVMEQQTMVLVTFNYRLGPLGFLSTGDDSISGNMGLKDQRLALEWVKTHIHKFGGNSSQILMAGFSAGAASVELHLLTPGIENLISAAVSFSGSALCPWVVVDDPLADAEKLAKILKCPLGDLENGQRSTAQIKECLQNAKAETIVESVQYFQSFMYNPVRVFGPVVESKTVQNAFITDKPIDLIEQSTHSKNIPWLATYTLQDGGISVAGLFHAKAKEILNDLPNIADSLLPIILMNYGRNDWSQTELANYTDKLWEKYQLPYDEFSEKNYCPLAVLATDVMLKDDIVKSLRLHGKHGRKIFSYIFDSTSVYNWGNFIANRTDMDFGAFHGDDVQLILNDKKRDLVQYPLSEDEQKSSVKLIKMLENFAATGVTDFDGCELALDADAKVFMQLPEPHCFYQFVK